MSDDITTAEIIETLAFAVAFHVARDTAKNANHCNPTPYESKLTSRLRRLKRLAMAGAIKVDCGG